MFRVPISLFIMLHVGIRKRRFPRNAGDRCLGNTHGYNSKPLRRNRWINKRVSPEIEVALSNNGSDETRYHYLKGVFPEQRPQRYKKDWRHSPSHSGNSRWRKLSSSRWFVKWYCKQLSQVIFVKCISVQAKCNKDSLHPDIAKLLATWHTKHVTIYIPYYYIRLIINIYLS
jgi:hypothetical protein